MKKLLNKPWFVAILALVAVAFVGHSLWPQRPVFNQAGFSPVTSNYPDENAEVQTPNETSLSSQSADLAALNLTPFKRDPFTPSVRLTAQRMVVEAAKPDLVETVHLSAIWSQNGEVYVLINGRIHQAGDEIGRLKIDSATADGVWLTHWKGRDHLTLGADFTLTTPAVMAKLPLPAL